MFLGYICPKVMDHFVTLGSFIAERAFYVHILCPYLDKMCMKIYANSRYKDKSAQTVVYQSSLRKRLSIRVSAVRSLISRRQPYCANPILLNS